LSPEVSNAQLPETVVSRTGRSRTAASLASAVEEVERDMIQTALDRSGGNISQTARTLGLTRRGLYLKLRRLGLETPRTELDTP
jgi:DNA-binding NtrC family response regulator